MRPLQFIVLDPSNRRLENDFFTRTVELVSSYDFYQIVEGKLKKLVGIGNAREFAINELVSRRFQMRVSKSVSKASNAEDVLRMEPWKIKITFTDSWKYGWISIKLTFELRTEHKHRWPCWVARNTLQSSVIGSWLCRFAQSQNTQSLLNAPKQLHRFLSVRFVSSSTRRILVKTLRWRMEFGLRVLLDALRRFHYQPNTEKMFVMILFFKVF